MQERTVFFVIVSYIVLAFAWWTFVLIDSNRSISTLRIQELEQQKQMALKETISKALTGGFDSPNAPIFNIEGNVLKLDTTLLKSFILSNYPDLRLNFKLDEKKQKRSYELEVDPVKIAELTSTETKRTWMFVTEGIVFVVLLFWGFDRIYRSYRQKTMLNRMQNNFLLSVTHELKTPLASAKLQLQTLQRHEFEVEKRKKFINNALGEMNRLHELMENILIASRLEDENYTSQKIQINLSKLVEDAVHLYQNISMYHQTITSKIDPDIFISGDAKTLQSAVQNLIENALKYSPADSIVAVEFEKNQNLAVLKVIDQGDGITEEDKKLIFQKFYRAGNEDTRTSKGTGLGLFIVKNVLKEHLSNIFVRDNQPKGSIFEVHFPINSI